VYATSADAYRGLRDFGINQSILVSGESGAGKTETVKILMGHLAHISGKKNDKTIQKVLQANPLLESFGNAKTARNDNSSRFGKFTQLQFNRFSVLAGSKCVTYLLEKSRVITQNEMERNYHIFHQVNAVMHMTVSKLYCPLLVVLIIKSM
jgi:myosin V